MTASHAMSHSAASTSGEYRVSAACTSMVTGVRSTSSSKRCREPPVAEDGRVEADGQGPQLDYGGVGLLDSVCGGFPEAADVAVHECGLKLEGEAEEPLI